MSSTVVYCNSCVCVCWNSLSADRSGMVASTLVERYLLCSTVLRFWLCFASHSWQIALELLHHGCNLNVLGFARNIAFFPGKRKFRFREKLARLRDGCGQGHFTVELFLNCARRGTEGSRWLFLFFVDAVLLCFACVEMPCALELLHPSDEFHSSVLQFLCVLELTVCRSQKNGCGNSAPADRIRVAAWRVFAAAFAGVRLLMAAWKLRMMIWHQFFSHFGSDDFPFQIAFKKCFKKIVVFPLCRRDPVLELQIAAICVAVGRISPKSSFFPLCRRDPVLELQIAAICGTVVRNSIVFRKWAFADRSGMAAWRFLTAAAAGVILLCFGAESRKSYCNGCMKVANDDLAPFFPFWHWWFSFKKEDWMRVKHHKKATIDIT